MENFDIFNLGIDNFKTEEKQVQEKVEYKTDPKLSKDSVYRAIIRFIPNIKNPKKSIVKKYSYWLESSEGEGFYVDCPSSINEKSVIQDTFWKLYKSDSAFDKKQSERIKRKEYYYSFVEIVKDPQQPELEGTVQIFRYPKAVKKLIDAQIQPDSSEIELGAEPINIFDFFEGKDFSIKVTLKGGYWNYEECKFATAKTPISIKGSKMENNGECRKQILSIYEGVKELEDFEFKPWSDDVRDKVHRFVGEITGNPGAAYANTTNYTKIADSRKETKSAPPAPKTENDPRIDAFENAGKKSSESVDDDIEGWLKEFDIK
jgi:hypothetical protein